MVSLFLSFPFLSSLPLFFSLKGRPTSTERLPDSARQGYDDDDSSLPSNDGPAWDGHGPEPSSKPSRFSSSSSSHTNPKNLFSPWDREVSPSEVEGGPRAPVPSNNKGAFDPIDNEEFYDTTGQTEDPNAYSSAGGVGGRKKSLRLGLGKKGKGIKGLIGHRERYENQGTGMSGGGVEGDRFEKMSRARGEGGIGGTRSREEEEYQDEFERELNVGASRKAGKGKSSASEPRFDEFENEGPEDAWGSGAGSGSSVGRSNSGRGAGGSSNLGRSSSGSVRGSATQAPAPAPLTATKTGGAVRGSREDDDCELLLLLLPISCSSC
ncbi:hypothetical protein P7C70_g1576, partial [Phenoliferia sp. Uapishka_3]